MAGRNSRKRTAPARLREETWYLVKYEDDENLRVLGLDDIQHIFPDEEDDIDVGDIISAIWLPNGQFYDAKVLQKGSDKNELMKERMRLEKAKKNKEKTMEEDPKQKRQNDKDGTKEKKKKRKLDDEAQSSMETNQKAKEKENREKKKKEEQRRKTCLLETRKAQAAQRWASIASGSESSTTETTFTPVPLRHANNSSVNLPLSSCEDSSFTFTLSASHDVLQTNQPQANPLTSVQQTPSQHTPPPQYSPSTDSTTSLYRTPAQQTTASQSTPNQDTPKAPAGRRQCPDPRRGIHFQSAVGDMSEGDDSEESDREYSGCVATESNSCGGCRELRIENEELRKRLEKVHKRLNIALKAKTAGEVTKNRPLAGVLDRTLAEEFKMIEVMEGAGVFWYAHQRAYCSALKSWQSYINAAIDMFFTKETLAASCAMGNDKKSKSGGGHQPLNAAIIQSLIGKVCSKFSKDGPNPSQVVQKINMKCVEARRPPRHRAI